MPVPVVALGEWVGVGLGGLCGFHEACLASWLSHLLCGSRAAITGATDREGSFNSVYAPLALITDIAVDKGFFCETVKLHVLVCIHVIMFLFFCLFEV